MMATLARRAGFTLAAGVLATATMAGTAAAATSEVAAPAAGGTVWCGTDRPTCEQSRLTYVHYGYTVSELTWNGDDNTCIPEHQCNGFYFTWSD